MRAPIRLAEKVGAVLGRGEVLQRALPPHRKIECRMKTLRLILGDQLNAAHPWFEEVHDSMVYLMAEMRQETDYVPHHIQKVLAFFAAMRAFAEARQAEGHTVVYLSLDDGRNTQGLEANVRMVMAEQGCERFEYQLPDEWRLDKQLMQLAAELGDRAKAVDTCLLYTSPSPRDRQKSRMPSSA